MVSAQVGSDSGQGLGDVHLRMCLNGQDIPNSDTIQTVNMDTEILIGQPNPVIHAGDQLQIIFSTDVTTGTLGLVASNPSNEPAVPSVLFTAFKPSFVADEHDSPFPDTVDHHPYVYLICIGFTFTHVLFI